MRVIAGDFKGRKLEAPIDNKVRPTSDKVKEAMFSILMNDIYGSVICDMFAGSGGLGIEGVSRGAKKCYFIDQSNSSIKLIIQNVSTCKAEEHAEIIQGDFQRALNRIKEKVDIFLIDPPYGYGIELKAMELIAEKGLLAEDGKIVVEHEKHDILPDEVAGFKKIKEKKYGRVVLSIYM